MSNENNCFGEDDEEESQVIQGREGSIPPPDRESINRWNNFISESQILRERSGLQQNSERQSLPAVKRIPAVEIVKCTEDLFAKQKACSICLGDFNIWECLTKTECDHLFHIQCLDEWAKKSQHLTCPVCRKDIAFGIAKDN